MNRKQFLKNSAKGVALTTLVPSLVFVPRMGNKKQFQEIIELEIKETDEMALNDLKERYVCGEIGNQEFEQQKKELL